MSNIFHDLYIGHNNHAFTANPDDVVTGYVDIAARDADTLFNTAATNINKAVRVATVPPSLYMLLSVAPTVWSPDLLGSESNTLAKILVGGNTTGGTNLIISAGDTITITDAPVAGTDGANRLFVETALAAQNEFIELTDTIGAYDGAGRIQQINATNDGLESGQALRTTDDPTFNSLTLTGDLTVQGTTTTLDTTTLLVEDKNIEMGVVATPTDVTADGGGITLKGATDKTIAWSLTDVAWQFNQIGEFQNEVSIGALGAPGTDLSLDLKANDKFLGFNAVTTAVRDTLAPRAGGAGFNPTTSEFEGWNGSVWVNFGASGGDVVGPAISVTRELARFDGITGKVIQGGGNAFLTDAGSMGVGTPTPLTQFTVESSVIAGARISVNETDVTLNNNPGYMLFNKGVFEGGIFYKESKDTVEIFNSNGVVAVIDSADNVGIGTGATALSANVNLTINDSNSGSQAIQRLKSFTGNTLQLMSKATGSVISNDNFIAFNPFSDNSVITPSNEAMRLTEFNGNPVVGILTETPEWPLDVNGFARFANRMASRVGDNAKEIFFPSDLAEFISGGVIILPTGSYKFMESMTLSNPIEYVTASVVDINFEGSPDTEVTFDIAGPIMSGSPATLSIFDGKIRCIDADAVMFDLTGVVFTSEKTRITMTGANSSLGTINSSQVTMRNGTLIGQFTGLTCDNVVIATISQMSVQPNLASPATAWRFTGTSPLGIFIDAQLAVIGPFGSLFYFDPVFPAPVNLQNIQQAGPGSFFEPGSQTGNVSLFINREVTGVTVNNVINNGGIARFSTAVPNNMLVGEEITHSTFTEATYNGTFTITSIIDASTYEAGISYVIFDTGSVTRPLNRVEVNTDGAHGLSDLEHITIENSVNYGGGYEIRLTSSTVFQIYHDFLDASADGATFDNGSQDETTKFVTAFNNGAQKASATTAEAFLTGNVIETDIPAVNALVILDANTWTGQQEELLAVKNEGSVRFDGLATTPLLVDADISVSPATATKTISVRLAGIHLPLRPVTFTNATNLINETATTLVDGDLITFHMNGGTLPAELRSDILYYVVNQLTDSFQVEYDVGAGVITFTDDGAGINDYLTAGLHGSAPKKAISSGTPQDISPTALIEAEPSDELVVILSNLSDAVDITSDTGYVRLVGTS